MTIKFAPNHVSKPDVSSFAKLYVACRTHLFKYLGVV